VSVEQKVSEVLAIAQQVYALKTDKVVFHGLSAGLANDREKLKVIFL
jgi:ABC-type branched-subunit amino acid transport system ATPase component